MEFPLDKVSVTRAGFVFACGPLRYDATMDFGLQDRELCDFLRGFQDKSASPRAGWRVERPEFWRRNSCVVIRRGEVGLRYLHLVRPSGKPTVLEFRYLVPPASVAEAISKYAAGLGKEAGDVNRQLGHESVSAEEGSADAGGGGLEHVEVGEGGAGQLGAGDRLEGLPGGEADWSGGRDLGGLLAVGVEIGRAESEGMPPSQGLLDSLAADLRQKRARTSSLDEKGKPKVTKKPRRR